MRDTVQGDEGDISATVILNWKILHDQTSLPTEEVF